jgi:peptidoglycan/xylan/chitin deacetylase (PgdA/CDA1 family)
LTTVAELSEKEGGADWMNALQADTSARNDKLAVARVLNRTPWHRLARWAEHRLRLIRVFNFHGTPERLRQSFAVQLDYLLDRYAPVDPYDVERIVVDGASTGPMAVFTFDDGLEGHFTVAAEELEARGARGIFCVAAAFPDVPVDQQAAWFRARVRAGTDAEHASDEEQRSMSWEQARELVTRGHRICSHTLTHEVITAATDDTILAHEIRDSRFRLEEQLGSAVAGFCWPVARDSAADTARALVRQTYAYALVGDTRPLRRGHDPYEIWRTRLEASWPLPAVEFQISGLFDAYFRGRMLAERLRQRRPG